MATFDLLADLPLEVDRYELRGLKADISPEFVRHTTLVELSGGGLTGLGEDVVYTPDEQLAFQAAGAVHDLAGSRTLGEFCELIESLDLFPAPPEMEASRLYRVWAFESAALDLALRQGGLSLAKALRREPQPMNYVASTRLGEPPTLEPVTKRLELDPTMRFKLDATSSWTPELFEQLVATGAVDSIDFKGMYKGTIVDQGADPVLYRRVVEAFPDAWLEDPDLSSPETAAALADVHDRITWDAPIHGIADIEALPVRPADGQHQTVADRRRCASCARPTTTAPRRASAPTAAARPSSASAAARLSTSRRCFTRTRRMTWRPRRTTRRTRPPACRAARCQATSARPDSVGPSGP